MFQYKNAFTEKRQIFPTVSKAEIESPDLFSFTAHFFLTSAFFTLGKTHESKTRNAVILGENSEERSQSLLSYSNSFKIPKLDELLFLPDTDVESEKHLERSVSIITGYKV